MMRSKKRDRVRQAIILLQENEQKYIDLTFWAEADKEQLLENEDYVSLKRIVDIEKKYSEDIKYVQQKDSWGYGFFMGMLASTKLYKDIILNVRFENIKHSFLDISPKIDYSVMKKVERVKQTVKLMYEDSDKYCTLVWYSRCNPDKHNEPLKSQLQKNIHRIQNQYPKETIELSGRNSDRQHGFHSGMLAGARFYSSVIDESLEQAFEDFPFLDS